MRKLPCLVLFGGLVIGCDGKVIPAVGSDQLTSDLPSDPIVPPPELPPDVEIAPVVASPQPLRRMTHEQWLGAVHDTLRLPDLPDFGVGNFPTDRGDNFLFGTDPDSLTVSSALFDAYRSRAEEIAAYVVASEARIQQLFGTENVTRTSVQSVIERLSTRAYRRPVSGDELSRLMETYDAGATNPSENLTPEQSGLLLVLRTLFESPYFIYIEIPPDGEDENGTQLTTYALAYRLSYFLWNAPPDDALLEAAESGHILDPSELDAQVQRMMLDERFEPIMYQFHNIALGDIGALSIQAPDLYDAAVEERFLFVTDAVQNDLSWADVLTAQHSFINSTLAEVYGIDGNFSPTEFTRVELPSTERKGPLTHVAFLAGVEERPVPRGVWLSQMLACNYIGAPVNADPTPPGDVGTTRRELWEAYTEAEGSNCAGCHTTRINPFGFALESYDERGQYRTHYGPEFDNSPIDTVVQTVLLDGEIYAANNANELVELIADAHGTHRCYAKHLTEFALGRQESSLDDGLIERLTLMSKDGRSIRELIRFIVQSESFRSHQLAPEHRES